MVQFLASRLEAIASRLEASVLVQAAFLSKRKKEKRKVKGLEVKPSKNYSKYKHRQNERRLSIAWK